MILQGGNTITYNPKWSYVPEHPYGMLIDGSSGSGKANTLLSLINQ